MLAQFLLIVSDVLSSLIVELSPLFFIQKPWRPVGCLLAHILQALWIGQLQAVCDWDNCCCTVAPLSGHHRVLKPSCTIYQVSSECSISDLAATLLHFRKKPWNFLNPFWVSGLDLWPIFYFLSVGGQYSVWVSVHLFWEVLYPSKPSLDEIQMQCLIRSLTYPTVYSVSLTNLILGSSILVSTTSLDNPIK